ncbi:PREDICTED: uncharacterized protein LOC101296462 [Fragaria vesca subsp. vesca]
MAIVLWYVRKGHVIKPFVGVKHVTDTTSASLKAAIDQFFSENGLSISSLRGQGYDGVSNMRGEFNGLKALILKDNHLVNVVGGSCKRRDSLREKQVAKIIEELNVVELLEEIKEDGSSNDHKQDASWLLDLLESFDFVFSLHLMKVLLGITNLLSQALQRRDQDIVNAMKLVKVCKEQLQDMRDNGWDSLLGQVVSFCEKYETDSSSCNCCCRKSIFCHEDYYKK